MLIIHIAMIVAAYVLMYAMLYIALSLVMRVIDGVVDRIVNVMTDVPNKTRRNFRSVKARVQFIPTIVRFKMMRTA